MERRDMKQLKVILVALFSLTFILTVPVSSQITPGEGFYHPDKISLPPGVEKVLPNVVRVKPLLKHKVILFESDEAAANARNEEGARDKIYVEGGGAIWPVLISENTSDQLCTNPIGQNQPGFHEICNTLENHQPDTYPDTLITDWMEGSGGGFIIFADNEKALIITNYHIVRETVERHNRQGGVYEPEPVPATDTDVYISRDGSHSEDSYVKIEGVKLISHASEEEWQQGLDWAVLEANISEFHGKEFIISNPGMVVVSAGERVWSAGFPTRTVRQTEEKPYQNATNDFRIAFGEVVEREAAEGDAIKEHDLITTLDAVSGSSGSPVFSEEGEVVGLLRDTTHRRGEMDLRVIEYGGYTLVVPTQKFRQFIEMNIGD